eukprot:scaffold262419_cov19-Tisochrysis_lutea.AAC.3
MGREQHQRMHTEGEAPRTQPSIGKQGQECACLEPPIHEAPRGTNLMHGQEQTGAAAPKVQASCTMSWPAVLSSFFTMMLRSMGG